MMTIMLWAQARKRANVGKASPIKLQLQRQPLLIGWLQMKLICMVTYVSKEQHASRFELANEMIELPAYGSEMATLIDSYI